jgi:hypothetical protein
MDGTNSHTWTPFLLLFYSLHAQSSLLISRVLAGVSRVLCLIGSSSFNLVQPARLQRAAGLRRSVRDPRRETSHLESAGMMIQAAKPA